MVRAVKVLTWLAVTLFLIVVVIVPRSRGGHIMLRAEAYPILFGPIILVDAVALVCFARCQQQKHKVSLAYPVVCAAVIFGVACVIGS